MITHTLHFRINSCYDAMSQEECITGVVFRNLMLFKYIRLYFFPLKNTKKLAFIYVFIATVKIQKINAEYELCCNTTPLLQSSFRYLMKNVLHLSRHFKQM